MQRLEPRELLKRDGAAFALAAIFPVAWWWAARCGWVPDVLDHDAGAAAVVATLTLRAGLSGLDLFSPASTLATGIAAILPGDAVASVRMVMALSAWASGFGGWRLARAWRPELGPGPWATGAALAQFGPWTLWPLVTGNVAALGAGPLLLALSLPWLTPLLAFWSAPVAALLGIEGGLSRSWPRRAALIGLLVLLAPTSTRVGAAFQSPPAQAPTSPAYAGAEGAWFPLPPAEAARWRAASAWFGGRWVHPMSEAVSGSQSTRLPPGALPLAIEAAVVPPAARTVTPSVWLAASVPEGKGRAWLRGGGLEAGVAPLAALVAAGIACRLASRRHVWRALASLAMLSGLTGFALPEARVLRVSGVELANLGELDGKVLFYPPPESPWFAGRWSEVQLRGVGAEAVAPAATVVALARLTDTSFDTAAAGAAWEARGKASLLETAAAEGVDILVIDAAALPGWGRARLDSALVGADVTGERDLRVVRLTPRSP